MKKLTLTLYLFSLALLSQAQGGPGDSTSAGTTDVYFSTSSALKGVCYHPDTTLLRVMLNESMTSDSLLFSYRIKDIWQNIVVPDTAAHARLTPYSVVIDLSHYSLQQGQKYIIRFNGINKRHEYLMFSL